MVQSFKCTLVERPLLLVNHLSISKKNYKVVFTILKNEYLDKDEITDNTFLNILDFSTKQEKSYTSLFLAKLDNYFSCAFFNNIFYESLPYGKITIHEVFQRNDRRTKPAVWKKELYLVYHTMGYRGDF